MMYSAVIRCGICILLQMFYSGYTNVTISREQIISGMIVVVTFTKQVSEAKSYDTS